MNVAKFNAIFNATPQKNEKKRRKDIKSQFNTILKKCLEIAHFKKIYKMRRK